MTKKETVALFGLIAALFPRDEKFTHPDATMRDAWAEMLATPHRSIPMCRTSTWRKPCGPTA